MDESHHDKDTVVSAATGGCVFCQVRHAVRMKLPYDNDSTVFSYQIWRKLAFQSLFVTSEPQRRVPKGFPSIFTNKYSRGLSVDVQIDWARERMNDCMSSHSDCHSTDDNGLLPTRLIDVSPDNFGEDVVLKISSGFANPANIKYVTLSYC